MLTSYLNKRFTLRRSFAPYGALTVILGLITVMMAAISIKTNSLGPIYSSGIFWLFFSALIFVGTRYQVYFEDGQITALAYGKPPITIAVADIDSIELESSQLKELLSFNRPQRRITITGSKKSIDVSVRHFRKHDVEQLLQLIAESRPDLRGDQVEQNS